MRKMSVLLYATSYHPHILNSVKFHDVAVPVDIILSSRLHLQLRPIRTHPFLVPFNRPKYAQRVSPRGVLAAPQPLPRGQHNRPLACWASLNKISENNSTIIATLIPFLPELYISIFLI